jgi:hypothetical protein
MPTVQSYGQRRVVTRALPGARRTTAPSPDAFGAQVGATLARVSSAAATTMANAERTRNDQVAVLRATSQLTAWENERLYNPETGALTIRGKDAQSVLDVVPGEFDTRAGELAAELSNDEQRFQFERFRLQRQTAIDYSLRRHVYGEMQQLDRDEFKGFVANMTSNAIANADQPALVGAALGELTQRTEEFARRQGLGPEQRKQMIEEARTNVHSGVISRFLSQDKDQAAQVYYDEVKEQIGGEARERIEKALEAGTLRVNAQRESDSILQGSDTLETALQKVRGIKDPELRDEVQQRVEHGFTIRDRQQREAEESTLTRLYNLGEKGGLRAVTRDPAWEGLSGGSRAGIRSYLENLANGTPRKTDQRRWYDLMTMATTPATQDQFAKTNLLTVRPYLSDSDFQQLAEIQGRIRAGDVRGANALAATEGEVKTITDESLRKVGLDPTPPEKGSKGYDEAATARVTEFRENVRRAVAIEEQRKGGQKLTTLEIQAIVDRFTIKTQEGVDRWFRADIPPQFGFERKAQVTRVQDVPAADAAAIRAAIVRQGGKPTDAQVIAVFNAKLARQRGEQ